MSSEFIRNPHLEGDAFFWQGGETGALLIHGFTATTAEVRLLGEHLHARGYAVSAPLLPGHQTTPQDMNRRRWREWTRAVDDAYAQLAARCERVFVCGESMGALLGLYLASEHPEIAGVVVYSPALRVASHSTKMLMARALARVVPHVAKPVGALCDADARWKGYSVNPIPALVQMNNLQREVKKRLSHIHQPLLVIQGRRDKTIDLRSGEIILRSVSSSDKEIHWLEESTHCVILDKEWERAAELTVKFIERVSDCHSALRQAQGKLREESR
jgi:carboxylesterase